MSSSWPVTVTTPGYMERFCVAWMVRDMLAASPGWTEISAGLPLLPNPVTEKRDYEKLKLLRKNQARHVCQLMEIKESIYFTRKEWELDIAKHAIQRETQKMLLLEAKLEIYEIVLQHVTQVAFNEIRLATDHSRKNDPNVIRAIVSFKQAGMLVDAVSLTDIANNNKLIVDISKISP